MTLRSQQIANDVLGKCDPKVTQALCLLCDEIVGLKQENKMLAQSFMQMADTINDLSSGMHGIGDVVKKLVNIRGEEK